MTQAHVLALGFFDGVHIGHGALLRRCREVAEQQNMLPAVVSFRVHPDTLVRGTPVSLICSTQDRIACIQRYYGIQEVEILPFDERTRQTPWDAFLDYTVEALGARHFVVGHDFRFGYLGQGNAQRLQEYCQSHGFGCDVLPAVRLDGQVVSSTRIRALVRDGDMERAGRYLGHPYLISGTVEPGYQLGRKLEAPTTNLIPAPDVLLPRYGVYATVVELPDGTRHSSVTNVGMRPTFQGDHVTVESHLLDFHGDLYGQHCTVFFYSFLRPEQRFETPEALMEQIRLDSQRAREINLEYL